MNRKYPRGIGGPRAPKMTRHRHTIGINKICEARCGRLDGTQHDLESQREAETMDELQIRHSLGLDPDYCLIEPHAEDYACSRYQ
ncbi:hypothetical protein NDU88_002426 [Pleurodeles waltl]|uniref:Uncharacterized protein n=1 Tax=Pleurodeles waltl TaxID=8319 RepID=A0AAV7WRM9_PLEWA|nr:hypothetical protein NDU88_002426 [Pleurodeles waltl]